MDSEAGTNLTGSHGWYPKCRSLLKNDTMPQKRLDIFISSVQGELAQARADLKAFLLNDAFLRRFVRRVFLFEDLRARSRTPDDVYLSEVESADIYIGIFGYQYGSVDAKKISPTEHEYNYATRLKKTRLIYLWGKDDAGRDPRMQALIRRAERQIVRRRVIDATTLNAEVYASLVDYLDDVGILRTPPFDAAPCDDATLKDISRPRLKAFIDSAHQRRSSRLQPSDSVRSLLTHLNLMAGKRPSNAGVLLFGAAPQRHHRAAECKCVHVEGSAYARPFASYQVYGGDLFQQVDQTREFVLSRLARSVGTRDAASTAPVTYELPPDAVTEAIVNAIAHRDYTSSASVEVRLLADRLEVWNPGVLPPNLSVEALLIDHPSVPANPLIADPLYLAGYIEKAGSGTQAMVRQCVEQGVAEPAFEQRNGSFVVTFYRDWLTPEVLSTFDLNDRQQVAIQFLKAQARIGNTEYQRITGASKRTAFRDLTDLVEKGLVQQVGQRGRSVHFVLVRKRATKGPNGPREAGSAGERKRAIKGPKGPKGPPKKRH